MEETKREQIGFLSVVSIGIGGMVGGGIFAVLGLSVQFARGGTPFAFLLAGIIAFITSYSYAKLSVRYPSEGGTVEFLNQAFGRGLFSGSLNILLWVSYVVMLALYSNAFGSYGSVFFPSSQAILWKHLLITGILILLTLLNMWSVKAVGKSEEWIVFFKITILLIFIAIGIWGIHGGQLTLQQWSSPVQVIAGGMIIFVAYEGFELIANTAQDVKDPRKNIPRAYYTAILFVIVLYILIAIVTVGSLSFSQILSAEDYALAMAAKPFLGEAGFTLIAIAAVLSTASAINATLYGTSRVSYVIAKEGELPKQLEKKVWNRPIEGLLLTSLLTLCVANFFDLSSISTMGSAGFLMIFAAVNGANLRLSKETVSSKWIPFTGLLLCLVALTILVWHTIESSPQQIWVLIIMVGASFLIEALYHSRRRQLKKSGDSVPKA